MGCVAAIIGLFLPRLVLFLAWLFSGWTDRAFDGRVWPFLGWLLMPYTTLAYLAAMLNNDRSVSSWWLALVIFAALADCGVFSSSKSDAKA